MQRLVVWSRCGFESGSKFVDVVSAIGADDGSCGRCSTQCGIPKRGTPCRAQAESARHPPVSLLTTRTSRVKAIFTMVELRGLEPLTFSLRTRRATNCAIAPQRPAGPISIETLPPQAVAACCVSVSSSSACATGSTSESGGASAVTGSSALDDDVSPGPDRSIVRTVRGARGLETYVGIVMGTGSQSAADFEASGLLVLLVLTTPPAPAVDTS